MNSNFNKIRSRTGRYSLPYLIKLSNPTETTELFFVDDEEDIVYSGDTYTAVTFEYAPQAGRSGYGGGGTLSIPALPEIVALIESNKNLKFTSIGVLLESGTVAPVKQFQHTYCKASLGGRKITLNFDRDDKAGMTFPALIFSHYNCRGLT